MKNCDNDQFVFLIGAGRSGTKFLRDLLSESSSIKKIPYDINYVWRYGNEDKPDDVLTINDVNEDNSSFIRRTLCKLSIPKDSEAGILLEKTVSNSLRVEFINRVFPDAKYIHLIRDGRAVTESSRREWLRKPSRKYLLAKLRYFPIKNYKYALWFIKNIIDGFLGKKKKPVWGPRYHLIEDDVNSMPLVGVCAKQWGESVQASLDQLDSIDKRNVFEVRYEQLVSSEQVIIELCKFLGITDIDSVVDKFKGCVVADNMNKWKSKLSEQDLKTIEDEVGELLRNLGYE